MNTRTAAAPRRRVKRFRSSRKVHLSGLVANHRSCSAMRFGRRLWGRSRHVDCCTCYAPLSVGMTFSWVAIAMLEFVDMLRYIVPCSLQERCLLSCNGAGTESTTPCTEVLCLLKRRYDASVSVYQQYLSMITKSMSCQVIILKDTRYGWCRSYRFCRC